MDSPTQANLGIVERRLIAASMIPISSLFARRTYGRSIPVDVRIAPERVTLSSGAWHLGSKVLTYGRSSNPEQLDQSYGCHVGCNDLVTRAMDDAVLFAFPYSQSIRGPILDHLAASRPTLPVYQP